MNAGISIEMAENKTSAIKEYGKRLFGFIRSKVRTEEDAEDLLQDVWYQLSNLSNIDEVESMSGWLYQVARNKITDYYRRKRTDSLEDHSYENEDGELSFKELLLMDNSDPDAALFKEVFWEELMNGLSELPASQRDVFVWNELEDMTLQQIADKTGENIKTIISRKGYAVKYLRQKLEALYKEINTI
ncbi:MAG: RNA polymerase sigma factor [Bacteroidia bacterium]